MRVDDRGIAVRVDLPQRERGAHIGEPVGAIHRKDVHAHASLIEPSQERRVGGCGHLDVPTMCWKAGGQLDDVLRDASLERLENLEHGSRGHEGRRPYPVPPFGKLN